MNKPIRWGIIGVGDVTEVKSGPALQKAEGSELVAVMRRNAAKAEDYANRHHVSKWYADADELIADDEVDAVYIATPPSSHKLYTLKAAAAGKPVFVEKPMALTEADCQEMIVVCKQHDVPLFVAYYRRKLPRFEKMRELVQSGAIGEPRMVVIRHFLPQGKLPAQAWKVDPAVNGGGYFVDMQAHTLDWLDHTFGPIQEIQGFAANQSGVYAAEDAVSIVIRWENGLIGTGTFAYATAHTEEQVSIYGSEGSVSMGFFRASPVVLTRDGKEEIYDLPDPPHVHQPLIQTIVDELLGRGTSPSTGISALRTTRLINQVLE